MSFYFHSVYEQEALQSHLSVRYNQKNTRLEHMVHR